MPNPVPTDRLRALNAADERPDGDHVLYWMTATRRTTHNFGLQRAAERALALDRPLIVFEPLRAGYRWASDRLHRFVIDGMVDNQRALAAQGVTYLPYVEPEAGAGKGLLEALAERACLVVTDDYPTFFLPRMAEAAARRLDVRLEAVDSNGLLPIHASPKDFARAYDFRRFLQRELAPHLEQGPDRDPLAGDLLGPARLPDGLLERWPAADLEALTAGPEGLADLPIDHDVPLVDERGGSVAARAALERFLDDRLARYGDERSQPESDAASGLSPWLHFGHLSTHEVLAGVAEREGWTPADITTVRNGQRSGWWQMSETAESFLDELVTWRELGFNFCAHREDEDRYESLPDWARQTLEEHADDPRPHLYTLEQFEAAETHDELWNAAQNQLRVEGRIHNYLRMLWAKKVLHWSASPREALDVLIELNNKYALDGRDPNSYSGILWSLGRYDRAWGPEREVFGKIRYMSVANTRRKLRMGDYVERWTERQATLEF